MDTEVWDDEEFDWLESACEQTEHNRIKPAEPPKRAIPASLMPRAPDPSIPFLVYRGRTSYLWEATRIEYAVAYITAAATAEWRVTFQAGQSPRPVALIQLCVQDPGIPPAADPSQHHCYLLHIHHCKDGIPQALRNLLASDHVLKTGIGINGDALKLGRDFGIEMQGIVDLSEIANSRLCDTSTGISPQKWSLTALAEKVLKGRVQKSQSIRCSDWEQAPLTPEQQKYAATDAWISLRLYEEMKSMPVKYPSTGAAPGVAVGPAAGAVGSGTPPASSSFARDEACLVPACSNPAALQPAKHAALQQYMQGAELSNIAVHRGIQYSTVQSYIAEGIIAGHSYDWSRLAVSENILFTIAEVAGQALKIPNLRMELPEAAGELSSYRPRDLLGEVLEARGLKIRGLQEELEAQLPGMGFGELRLAMAHLGRCNPAGSRTAI